MKKTFIKTRDGTTWEVVRELPKEYEVKSRWKTFISKHMVVSKFVKEIEDRWLKGENYEL